MKIVAVQLFENQLSKPPTVPRANPEPETQKEKQERAPPLQKTGTVRECIVLVFLKTLVFYGLFFVFLSVPNCPVHYGTVSLFLGQLICFRYIVGTLGKLLAHEKTRVDSCCLARVWDS